MSEEDQGACQPLPHSEVVTGLRLGRGPELVLSETLQGTPCWRLTSQRGSRWPPRSDASLPAPACVRVPPAQGSPGIPGRGRTCVPHGTCPRGLPVVRRPGRLSEGSMLGGVSSREKVAYLAGDATACGLVSVRLEALSEDPGALAEGASFH